MSTHSLPETLPALAGPGDTLAVAAPARPRPFLLATAGCSLRGVESRAVDACEHQGRILLAGLAVEGAVGGNVLLAPAQARRELVTRSGTCIESLLVTSAGMLGRWTTPVSSLGENQGSSADPIELIVTLPGETGAPEGSILRTEGPDGVRLVRITPAPAWTVERGPRPGTVRVRARVNADDVRFAAASGADARAAEDALRRLSRFVEGRAEAALGELRSHRLAVHTGIEEVDDGLAWAVARLEAALASGGEGLHALSAGEPLPFDPEGRHAWTVLGALVAGSPVRPRIPPGHPLAALARARATTLRGQSFDRSFAAALDAAPLGGEAAATVAWRAALLETANALEPWGGRDAAEALRARATRPATSGGASGARAIRLPTLGAAAPREEASGVAAALAAALDLTGRTRYEAPMDDPPPGLARALAGWAALEEGDVDRGFALVRAHLADGFAHGAGLWPDADRIHDPASAALVPLALAHGLLGMRVDAHYGRLRLAPRLPSHWTRFEVSGIQVGEARVRFAYERDGRTHRFQASQESGAMPVMLVLEPSIASDADAPTRVDGEVADLEIRATRTPGRVQPRVQLPLEREREMRVG